MFAPNIISDEFGNRDMAISPKGDEIFYTMQFNYGMLSTILYAKKVGGKWTAPEVADFCGKYKDLEPAFSYDGTKLYFSSNTQKSIRKAPLKNPAPNKLAGLCGILLSWLMSP